jgi:hypothetical protein
MLLVKTLVPFLVLRNSRLSLNTSVRYFCSRIKFTVDVRIIGGVRPVW